MTQAEKIIERFGGLSAMARALGHRHPTTVQGWKSRGYIPARHQQLVLERAQEMGVALVPDDFFDAPQEARAE